MDAKDMIADAGIAIVELQRLERDPTNVRVTDTEPSLALIASLKAKGVIVPLIVRPGSDGTFLVLDGFKRLQALRGFADKHAEIPVRIIVGDDAGARALSLAAAIVRDELHDVDRYEAFAQLVDDGAPPEKIAADYAMDLSRVRRILALGALAAPVRAAWREGRLDDDTAKAFAISPDHGRQIAVLAKLSKRGGRLDRYGVLAELRGKKSDAAAYIKFVGVDAYRAAGGTVAEDLFGGDHIADDPGLAKRLADEKLAAACAGFVANGWSWACAADELEGSLYNYGTLRYSGDAPLSKDEKKRLAVIETLLPRGRSDWTDEQNALAAEREAIKEAAHARDFSADEKSRSGVVAEIDRNGALRIHYARIKPEAMRAEKTKAKRKEKAKAIARGGPAGPELSQALSRRLSHQLTKAAGVALIEAPDLAMAVLLAGFIGPAWSVVKVRENGLDTRLAQNNGAPGKMPGSMADALSAALEWAPDSLALQLARVAAAALDFETFGATRAKGDQEAIDAICDRLPKEAMATALLDAFDADDYFQSASAAVCQAALREMAIEWPSSAKKPALAALALDHQKKLRWLPPQLRTANYAGPGSASAAAIHEAHTKAAGKAKGADKAPAKGNAPAKGAKAAVRVPAKRRAAK